MTYVIKDADGKLLYVDEQGAFGWTADPTWALQFARQQDAQMLSRADKMLGQVGLWRTVGAST